MDSDESLRIDQRAGRRKRFNEVHAAFAPSSLFGFVVAGHGGRFLVIAMAP